jgi:recombination protein RecR
MNSLEKLARMFADFPGIGPRQSKRFVYFLLSRDQSYLKELISLLQNLKSEIVMCGMCFRYFPKNKNSSNNCPTCSDTERDRSKLLVVARDVDYENMEKTGVYTGLYFVLGSIIPILEKEPEKRVRLLELKKRIDKDDFKEIIIAVNANPEGENTENIIREHIREICEKKGIKISTLGRGLSTGTELEYSDGETLKNALSNRHS